MQSSIKTYINFLHSFQIRECIFSKQEKEISNF